MSDQFTTPDAETRAKSISNLKAAGKLLDLWTLELDEAIVALDKHLLQQRRARLLYKADLIPTEQVE
jgi:hypothetical protein